nr:uncharacterized protein LOC108948371 [Nicotiana tomentosiformis]
MRGARHDAKTREAVEPYAVLIARFLASTSFYRKRHDIDLTNELYRDRPLADPLAIHMVDDLPQQEDADCGVYVASFAEYFIHQRSIPADFDAEQHRKRFGTLLWDYGRTKQENEDESEPEFCKRSFRKMLL